MTQKQLKKLMMFASVLFLVYTACGSYIFAQLPEETQDKISQVADAIPHNEITLPLFSNGGIDNKEFTTTIVEIPLLVSNIKLADFSVRGDFTH